MVPIVTCKKNRVCDLWNAPQYHITLQKYMQPQTKVMVKIQVKIRYLIKHQVTIQLN